tara:strand:+ start:267 stop:479 length:213 start_codon:yes stop_codon:yes gene_type:complete
MTYHPIIGIIIFLIAILASFLLGRNYIKKNIYQINKQKFKVVKGNGSRIIPPRGEITSPDAPWLKQDGKE